MTDLTTRSLPEDEWLTRSAGFSDMTFEQSLGYAAPAAARIGGQLRLVAVEREGRTVGLASIRVKTVPGLGCGIAWIPSGPLTQGPEGPLSDATALQAVLEALRARFADGEGHVLRLRLPGIAFAENAAMVDTATMAGFHATDRAPFYRSIALDLRRDEATLMARLDGKWRTDLRFALKSGLELDQCHASNARLKPEMIDRFMRLYRSVQQAKGFRPDITPEFHFSLIQKARDYTLDILIATKNGQDVAGIVTGRAGRTATYLFGATAPAGRPLRAGYFLQWEGMALARKAGCEWYDLGGVDPAENPDVARFKERMGGEPVLAQAYEARPGGIGGRAVLALEGLRARLRRRQQE